MGEGTLEKNKTPNSDISGATISVPQVNPVFSYRVSGGEDINVYLIRTQGTKVVIATFDDGYSEEPYAVSSLHSGNVGLSLVYSAIESFQQLNPNTPNLFRELAQDRQAIRQLNDLLASIFYQGE